MAELIDPALAQKLDAFTVPALPADFGDRLVAAAIAQPTRQNGLPSTGLSGTGLPPLRRPASRRWLRGGATGFGIIAVGMISISAAAMGYFGEPIRSAVQQAPVLGKVIERVLPKAARPARKLAPARLAKPAPPPVPSAASAAPVSEAAPAVRLTPLERRERRRAIMADPEARKAWIAAHPVAAERIARRRAEAGLAPQPGPLLRRERLGPEERMELRERLRERRQRRLERRGMLRESGELPLPDQPPPQ